MKRLAVLVAIALTVGIAIGTALIRTAQPEYPASPEPDDVPASASPESARSPVADGRESDIDGNGVAASSEGLVPVKPQDPESQERIESLLRLRRLIDDASPTSSVNRYSLLSALEGSCIAVILNDRGRGIPTTETTGTEHIDYPVFEGEYEILAFGKRFKFHELEFPEYAMISKRIDRHFGVGAEARLPIEDADWLELVMAVDQRLEQSVSILSR